MTDLTCPECGTSVPADPETHAPPVIELVHGHASSALTIEAPGCELRLVVRGGSRQDRADYGLELLEFAVERWRKG